MTESNDPTINYKKLVRAGYDSCAELYAAARRNDDSNQLEALLNVLSDGASVLDLGCGAGVPITSKLAERYCVTGIDTSEAMLRLARSNLSNTRFLHSDILDLDLDESSFDAVVAIFVLFHLPREEHNHLFQRVWSWLHPGGYFLLTLTEHAKSPHLKHDFFGTKMYWSNLGLAEYKELLACIGFDILHERIVGHGYGPTFVERDECHPMMLLQKPLTTLDTGD